MKTKDLVKAAEELNELLFDEKSAIKVEKLTATPNKLAVKVMQASELLVMEAYEVEGETIEADEVTDETMAIINGINAAEDNIVWEDEKVVKTPAKKAKKEVVEAEEVQVEQTTAEMIQECELPALKQIAAEYPEFAKALPALKKFKAKDLDTMKATMIAILEKVEVEEKVEDEKVVKKVLIEKKETPKAEKKTVVVPVKKEIPKTTNTIPVLDSSITIGTVVTFEAAKSHKLSGQNITGTVIQLSWEQRSSCVFAKIKNDEGITFHKVVTALSIFE